MPVCRAIPLVCLRARGSWAQVAVFRVALWQPEHPYGSQTVSFTLRENRIFPFLSRAGYE